MYWLRWHYHVKDIAGAPYKIKMKRKANKTTESPAVGNCGQTTVILCSTITIALSNDDRKSTVFSSRRNVVSDSAFLTDDGRLFHARVEALFKLRIAQHYTSAAAWWMVTRRSTSSRFRVDDAAAAIGRHVCHVTDAFIAGWSAGLNGQADTDRWTNRRLLHHGHR